MSKKAKSKTKRGPTVRQVGASIAENYPSIAAQAASIGRGLVESAVKLGQHKARAELLAPILEDLSVVAMRQPDGLAPTVVLTPSACRIVLACLAEAGYTAAPKPPTMGDMLVFSTTQKQATTAAWDGVPGSGAEEAPPVAKAA